MNSKKSLTQRVFALVMALVLAVGLVPSTAWASKLDYKTATLQIALDTNSDGKNDLVLNKSYHFVGEKTLEDLFAAAKAAGDILDYKFKEGSYGTYINEVTVTNGVGAKNADNFASYWANYKNGAYATGTDCTQGDALADGVTFSFGFEGYPGGPTEVDWSSTEEPAVSDYFIGELATGATLQLGYDTDNDGKNDLVLNKVYGFEDGATVGDLFEAAKAAGDIKDYVFEDSGYGAYLVSVTLANGTEINNGPSYSSYWASYMNGDYNLAPKQTDALKDGAKYQFGYEKSDGSAKEVEWAKTGYPVVSTAVAKKSGDTTPGGDDADPKPSTNVYDAEKAALLLENLAARFKKDSADASVSNDTFQAAVALNQLGLGADLDADAIVANLEKSMADAQSGDFSAGTYAKYILALTAAGVDCTKVTFSDGTVHNAVDEMNAMVDDATPGVYAAVCILPVYQTYADNAGREAKLIDIILDAQGDSGLFGATGWEDSQTTAQAITALLPYRNSRSDVTDAIEKAVNALFDLQCEDGGFAYMYGKDTSNLDATSEVIVALTALGYDCAEGQDLLTSNGSSPLGWLVAQADQDSLDGFQGAEDSGLTTVEQMSAAVAVFALTADAQYSDTYAPYAFKAVERNVVPAETPKAEEPAAEKPAAKKNVPSTGDESVAGVAVLAVAVAGGVAIVESKRRRNAA